MTSFTTQTVCGPVISSFGAKDKGDLSNRVKCAGAQAANNLSAAAQTVLVAGGAFGAAKYVSKSPQRISKLANLFDKGIKALKLPQSNTFVQKLLNAPGKGKAAAILILPAVAAINFITGKHLYKMGQIDQKYTDRAKLEAHYEKNILV